MAKSHVHRWLLASLLVVAFLFTRLYKIQDSLLFFNDMGRDFLVLQDWQSTGKPPLLGPQTSAFSFNQSPVYYYLLYPAFLLTGHSPFSTIITGVLWYLGWYIFGIFTFRADPRRFITLLIIAALITAAPQILRQNRFIWNPSFTPPLLIALYFAYQSLLAKLTFKAGWVFAITGLLAIGLTYATVPVFVLLTLSLLWHRRRNIWPLIGQMSVATIIVFAPMLVFELRHHFTLTFLLFHGQHLAQTATSLPVKIQALAAFIPGILALSLIALFNWLKKSQASIIAGLTLLLLLFTLVAPVNLESHYIFPLLTLFIFTASMLPRQRAVPITLLLCSFWLLSPTTQAAFRPAARTVGDLQGCYRRFCPLHREPLYVSMQSGILPYHNAPEHRFFMREASCRVLDIETSQKDSATMAVVVDNSTYEHGKTAYNELTLFGPSTDTLTFTCQQNLTIHVLKRI